jgi:hypothetical protein
VGGNTIKCSINIGVCIDGTSKARTTTATTASKLKQPHMKKPPTAAYKSQSTVDNIVTKKDEISTSMIGSNIFT